MPPTSTAPSTGASSRATHVAELRRVVRRQPVEVADDEHGVGPARDELAVDRAEQRRALDDDVAVLGAAELGEHRRRAPRRRAAPPDAGTGRRSAARAARPAQGARAARVAAAMSSIGALAGIALEPVEHLADPRPRRDVELLVQPRVAEIRRDEERRHPAARQRAAEPGDHRRPARRRVGARDDDDPARLRELQPHRRRQYLIGLGGLRLPPAPALVARQHGERRQPRQALELPRAGDPRRHEVAAQRGEHGEEERREGGQDRVLDRLRRVRRSWRDARPPPTCSSSPVTSVRLSSASRSRTAPISSALAPEARSRVRAISRSAARPRHALAIGGAARGRGTRRPRRWRSRRRRPRHRPSPSPRRCWRHRRPTPSPCPRACPRSRRAACRRPPRARRGRSAAAGSSPAAASRSRVGRRRAALILEHEAGHGRVGLREHEREDEHGRGHRDDDERHEPGAAAERREVPGNVDRLLVREPARIACHDPSEPRSVHDGRRYPGSHGPSVASAKRPTENRRDAMRVLLVSSFVLPHAGGVEQFVATLRDLLEQSGCEVRVLACRRPGEDATADVVLPTRFIGPRDGRWSPAAGGRCWRRPAEPMRSSRTGRCTSLTALAVHAGRRRRVPSLLVIHGSGQGMRPGDNWLRPARAAFQRTFARSAIRRSLPVSVSRVGVDGVQRGYGLAGRVPAVPAARAAGGGARPRPGGGRAPARRVDRPPGAGEGPAVGGSRGRRAAARRPVTLDVYGDGPLRASMERAPPRGPG